MTLLDLLLVLFMFLGLWLLFFFFGDWLMEKIKNRWPPPEPGPDSLIVQAERLRLQLEQLQRQIGEALIPVVDKMADMLRRRE